MNKERIGESKKSTARNILLLLLAIVILSCFVACKKDFNNQGNINETNDTSRGIDYDNSIETAGDDNSIDDTSDKNEEIADVYVGSYAVNSDYVAYSTYLITENGQVEKIGATMNNVKFTEDGRYAVWHDSDRVPWVKEPGEPAQKFLYDLFLPKTGVLINFWFDGIYVMTNPSEGSKKVSDLIIDPSTGNLSNDGQYYAYVDDDSLLHLLNLENFDDKVIASNVTDEKDIVCLSDTEIYYWTANEYEEYELFLWNGKTSETTELKANNTWQFRNRHIPGVESLNYIILSPNQKYVITIENDAYYHYRITDEGLVDRECLGDSGVHIALDDGASLIFNTYGLIKIVYNGTLKELTGDILCGYYYNYYPPYIDGVLYYAEGSTLKSYNVHTDTIETIVEDIWVYQVVNGFVYYITNDKDMYRVGIDEKLADNVYYLNAAGFIK